MEDVGRLANGLLHRSVVGQAPSHYLHPASNEFGEVSQIGICSSQDSHLFTSVSENLRQPPA